MAFPQIFLSTWSIKRAIERNELDVFALPDLAKEYGFQGIEIIDRHLPEVSDNLFQILAEKIKANDLQCTVGLTTNFVIDDETKLERQISYAQSMIEKAKGLNAVAIRILLGGYDFFFQRWLQKRRGDSNDYSIANIKKGKKLTNWLQKMGIFPILHKFTIQAKRPGILNENEKKQVLKALDKLVDRAEALEIPLATENHWGITTLPENIIFFIEHYSSRYLGVCIDLGNFSRWQDRYQGMEKLLPWAKEIHAKSYDFDAHGEERSISYQRVTELLQKKAAQVPIVVEYEGNGDQLLHSLKTADLIRKYWIV